MIRRLHSRIIGMGALGSGMAPSPPAEVFLKSLPSPAEIDPAKFSRFQREEAERLTGRRMEAARTAATKEAHALEPFFDIVDAAAGHRHVLLLTREGNLITFGGSQYGQTGVWTSDTVADGARTESEHTPLLLDLDGAFCARPARVACGSNFSFVYSHHGRRVVALGNNHVGQLGTGHKASVDRQRGFVEWNPNESWWPSANHVIDSLVCGYNHSILQLTGGLLYAFGSNTWGELGIGTTVSPMQPTAIKYFSDRQLSVKKVAAGNSFTLFLTEEGRVYGCGATNDGQLPPNSFEPVPIPLLRCYDKSTDSTTSSGSPNQLIRVVDIACVSSCAAFLTAKNELLLQGSLPDFGVHIPSPRFVRVDQSSAIQALCARAGGTLDPNSSGFRIADLISGPTTLLVRYENGCVAALGANTEGQLCFDRRWSKSGKLVNLAPAFAATTLLPVMVPAMISSCGPARGWQQTRWVAGRSFHILLDHEEVYPVEEEAEPIELPPAAGRTGNPRRQLLKSSLT